MGIKDNVHEIIGTTFSPTVRKIGNEELENWLIRMLKPRIDFKIHEFFVDGKLILLFESPASINKAIRSQISIINIKKNLDIGGCVYKQKIALENGSISF